MSIDNSKNNPDSPEKQGTGGVKPNEPTHVDTNPPRPGDPDAQPKPLPGQGDLAGFPDNAT